VWNPRHPWYHGDPLFFGFGLRTRRLIAFSASCGNHDAEAGLDSHRSDGLRRFDAVSVRDDNSKKMVDQALGRPTDLTLDPCLQFPPTLEPADEPDRYAVIYGHSFPSWLAPEIRRWAHSRRCSLVSVGYRNDWADRQEIAVGPTGFARLIARAEAVVTNFFHGCVFALLTGRPFACIASPYRANKVRGLTDLLGASRHLIGERTPSRIVDAMLDEPQSPAIGERIGELRRRSNRYLDHAFA
jgi:polysaccharide pyruvyl transferase WcaK-like protein